jgi:hypothetical protein
MQVAIGTRHMSHLACGIFDAQLQTFLNFNASISSSSQAIQQELPAIFSTANARAVEGLTVTGTVFTALTLAGCVVSCRCSSLCCAARLSSRWRRCWCGGSGS